MAWNSFPVKDLSPSIFKNRGLEFQALPIFYRTLVFSIMERAQLNRVMEEQKFSLSGTAAEEDIIKIGRLLVVQYFLIGSINRIGGNYLINIRLVDVEKGGLVQAESIEVRSEGEISSAIRSLVRKITELTPIRGKVISIRGNEVIVSLGSQDRLQTGMMLRVQRLGEAFKDPATGKILGREVIELGVLRVAKIMSEELSSALIVEEYGKLEIGDIVAVWTGAPHIITKPEEKPEEAKPKAKPEEKPKPIEVAGDLTFEIVVDNLDIQKNKKSHVKEFWRAVKGKEVVWSGSVRNLNIGRKSAKIFIANNAMPLINGYNILLITRDKEKAEKLNAGQQIKFKGSIADYDRGKSGDAVVVYIILENAEIL
ncbi:MAG: CsgG/HfaB family protein [Nitrospirota bacterium]